MFDLTMYTPEQVADYLALIEYEGDGKPTYDTLKTLLFQHLTHVRFENLDILGGIRLSVDPAYLFQKVVKDHKGGFCFELNGAFSHLLRSMGFEVTDHLCRMTSGMVRPRLHRVSTIKVDGSRFMADVGLMGDMSRVPLELAAGKEQNDGVNSYKMLYHDYEGWRMLQRMGLEDGPYTSKYHFRDDPQMPQDFVTPCFYCEMSPESSFRAGVRVSKITEDACYLLSSDTFRVFHGADVQETPCATQEEKSRVLNEVFGLSFR